MTAIRTIPATSKAKAKPAGLRGRAGVVGAIMTVPIALQDRSRYRQHLRQLDDRLLLDVGMSKEDMRREVDKPIWRG